MHQILDILSSGLWIWTIFYALHSFIFPSPNRWFTMGFALPGIAVAIISLYVFIDIDRLGKPHSANLSSSGELFIFTLWFCGIPLALAWLGKCLATRYPLTPKHWLAD